MDRNINQFAWAGLWIAFGIGNYLVFPTAMLTAREHDSVYRMCKYIGMNPCDESASHLASVATIMNIYVSVSGTICEVCFPPTYSVLYRQPFIITAMVCTVLQVFHYPLSRGIDWIKFQCRTRRDDSFF